MRVLAAVAVLFLWACGGQAPSPTPLGNVVPRARLSAPLYAPVGEPVVFDAGASYDPDGALLEYTFSFSDGSAQVTQPAPEVLHVFEQPGAFEVAVIVRDDGGLYGRATQLVVARTDPPSCAAASECRLGEDCRDQLCYATGAGPGPGVGECIADSECGTGLTCRAGLCLSTGSSAL